MDCKLNNIEALLHSLLSKVDILSHKMDRFQDRISAIEGRIVYFEKQLHQLKLSQSQSDSIIPSQASSKSHHTPHNSERQTYSTPRNRQTVYNLQFMYHNQSLHGNVGPPPPPSRPSVPSWRPKPLQRTNTNLSTSLPLSKSHSQPVAAVSQKNEPPEPVQDSNHADDPEPMQVDIQPALLMSQSEPSPPLQYGMPKDYWKSARDNMNSLIMRTLKTRPPEYVVDYFEGQYQYSDYKDYYKEMCPY